MVIFPNQQTECVCLWNIDKMPPGLFMVVFINKLRVTVFWTTWVTVEMPTNQHTTDQATQVIPRSVSLRPGCDNAELAEATYCVGIGAENGVRVLKNRRRSGTGSILGVAAIPNGISANLCQPDPTSTVHHDHDSPWLSLMNYQLPISWIIHQSMAINQYYPPLSFFMVMCFWHLCNNHSSAVWSITILATIVVITNSRELSIAKPPWTSIHHRWSSQLAIIDHHFYPILILSMMNHCQPSCSIMVSHHSWILEIPPFAI